MAFVTSFPLSSFALSSTKIFSHLEDFHLRHCGSGALNGIGVLVWALKSDWNFLVLEIIEKSARRQSQFVSIALCPASQPNTMQHCVWARVKIWNDRRNCIKMRRHKLACPMARGLERYSLQNWLWNYKTEITRTAQYPSISHSISFKIVCIYRRIIV